MSKTRYKILPGDLLPYFITTSTINWIPLFSNPDIAHIVIESLGFLCKKEKFVLFAYVLMENHLHLIAADPQLSQQIAYFKSYTARKSIDTFLANGNQFMLEQLRRNKLAHRYDRTYQFWQQGYYPQRLQTEAMFQQKLDYIHFNPVRRGYIDKPEHWRYSSARNYAGLDGLVPVSTDWNLYAERILKG